MAHMINMQMQLLIIHAIIIYNFQESSLMSYLKTEASKADRELLIVVSNNIATENELWK